MEFQSECILDWPFLFTMQLIKLWSLNWHLRRSHSNTRFHYHGIRTELSFLICVGVVSSCRIAVFIFVEITLLMDSILWFCSSFGIQDSSRNQETEEVSTPFIAVNCHVSEYSGPLGRLEVPQWKGNRSLVHTPLLVGPFLYHPLQLTGREIPVSSVVIMFSVLNL